MRRIERTPRSRRERGSLVNILSEVGRIEHKKFGDRMIDDLFTNLCSLKNTLRISLSRTWSDVRALVYVVAPDG